MEEKRVNKPEYIFLILALIFGIAFLFITPPFQVPDEGSHFYKAFYVSEGHLTPGQNDQFFPQSLQYSVLSFNYLHGAGNKQNMSNTFALLNLPLNYNDKEYLDISNVVIYPPVSYLAASLVMGVEKYFGVSPLILMYSGRLINLLVWIVLIFFAIRITPIHKWVFLLLALMPMTLFVAASLSADSFTIGLSFLAIAMFLKLAFVSEKIDIKDILLMFIIIFTLSLSKQGYAILILLFFIIPKSKFKDNKFRITSFALIGTFTLLFTGLWNYLFKESYMASASLSASDQISFILSNPLNFPYVLSNTLLIEFKNYMVMFVGDFGWLDTPLPAVVVGAYLLILIIVALMDKTEVKINLNQKSIFLVIFSLISILIFAFEYITWTAVGLNHIKGIQGRYFIPIAPLLLLLFYNNIPSLNIRERIIKFELNKKTDMMIVLFITVILVITVIKLILRYYTL
jgi:uncharacterized membrane protein